MTTGDSERLDPGKVAAIHQEFSADLMAFLIGLLRDRDLAGEALQATFTKAVEVGHTAREETIKGWLFRVAHNEAMAIRRRQGLDHRTLARLSVTSVSSSEDGLDNACRVEDVARVRNALKQLPGEQREVVRRRVYDEQKFADIASDLNLPLGTVLTRMRLALQKLSRRLADDEHESKNI